MATTQTILEATIKAGVEHFGGFPSGSMIAFAGKAVPDGWLLCNGALVSRTTYAKLFAAIGTAWGAGDGSTTFKLPDADGRVMQGVTDASKVGQYLEAGLPNIIGKSGETYLRANSNSLTGAMTGTYRTDIINGNASVGSMYNIGIDASKSNSLYGSSSKVQVKALQTLTIIKI